MVSGRQKAFQWGKILSSSILLYSDILLFSAKILSTLAQKLSILNHRPFSLVRFQQIFSEFFGRVGIQFEDLILSCKYRKGLSHGNTGRNSGYEIQKNNRWPWISKHDNFDLSTIQEEVNVKNPISFRFSQNMDNVILSINHVTLLHWRRHSKVTVVQLPLSNIGIFSPPVVLATLRSLRIVGKRRLRCVVEKIVKLKSF